MLSEEEEEGVETGSAHSSTSVPLDEYDGQRTFKREPRKPADEPTPNLANKRTKQRDKDDLELVKTKAPWGEYRKPRRKRQKKGKRLKPGKPRDGFQGVPSGGRDRSKIGKSNGGPGAAASQGNSGGFSGAELENGTARVARKPGHSGSTQREGATGFFNSLLPKRGPLSFGRTGGGQNRDRVRNGSGYNETGPNDGFGVDRPRTNIRAGRGGDQDQSNLEEPGSGTSSRLRRRGDSDSDDRSRAHGGASAYSDDGENGSIMAKLQNTLGRKKKPVETTSYRTDDENQDNPRPTLLNRMTRRQSRDTDVERAGEFKDRSIRERGGNLRAKANRKNSTSSQGNTKSRYRNDSRERSSSATKRSKFSSYMTFPILIHFL